MILSKVKEFIYSVILIFVFVMVTINLAIYTLENAQTIQDVLPLIGLYLFTRFILPIVGLFALAYTIRAYIDRQSNPYSLESIPTNQSQGGEGGGAYTPTHNTTENSNVVGELVKNYLYSINQYKFSLTNYSEVANMYNSIGFNPTGENKKIQNENFGRLLLRSIYFEQENTYIKLKPLYYKTTAAAANSYYLNNEAEHNKTLLADVRRTYEPKQIGQEVNV
ncbi:MAG: hypothetical protein KA278_08350 [Flavobacterium sp.]|nr:hypothetical protein [Flavobacterium sp.]